MCICVLWWVLPCCFTHHHAFQKEAEKRGGLHYSEWQRNELEAVYRAATWYAAKNGLVAPTRAQVVEADISASGHVDYGRKLAYRIAEIMKPKGQNQRGAE